MGSIVSKAHEIIEEHGSFENYIKSFNPTVKQPKTMNFKTFSVTDQNIEVCIHRERDNEGDDYVLITAFIPDHQGDESFNEEVVNFSSDAVLKQYISDYSKASAEAFVLDRMPIKE